MPRINILILSVAANMFFSFYVRAEASQLVDVQHEFRAEPTWYWKSPKGKCVPVPAYDIISRIAPKRIREAKILSNELPCHIKLGDRRIEANLICNGKVLEKYYSKEILCKESFRPVASTKAENSN